MRNKSIKKLVLFMMLIFLMSFHISCMNEMQHMGGWSPPIASDDHIFISSSDGYIYRFSRDTGYHDNLWKFPNGDVSLGAFYGDMMIKEGILYGSSYGDGNGKKCQSRECVTNIFAIDIISGNSIWSESLIRLDSTIVGGVNIYSDKTLIFATSENDDKDGIGSYIYGIDIQSDSEKSLKDRVSQRILWKVPIKGKIYGKILIHENLAIVGTISGSLIAIDLRSNEDLISEGEKEYLFNDPDRLVMELDWGSPIVSSPLDAEEHLCFGDISGAFKCLDKKEIELLSDKKIKFESDSYVDQGMIREILLDGWIWAKPVFSDGIAYVSTLSGNIYAIDVNSLSIIWETKAKYKGKPLGSSTIFNHSGLKSLAVPFDKETVGIFDVITGSVLGEFPVDDGVSVMPLVVDNLLYVIDLEGRVKTFSTADRTLVRCFDLEKLEGCK